MIPLHQLSQMKSRELPDITSVAYSIQSLLKHQEVILTRDNQPAGFVTLHDVINYTDLQ